MMVLNAFEIFVAGIAQFIYKYEPVTIFLH